MDDFIKVSAKTVEDAVLEASIQLGTSSDNIEYHIIERETKGFLGIGAKKALIEARKKTDEEDFISEIFHEKEPSVKNVPEKESIQEKKSSPKPEKKAVKEVKKTEKKSEKASQKAAKNPEKTEKPVKPEKKESKKEKVHSVSEKETDVRPDVRPAAVKTDVPADKTAESEKSVMESEKERAPKVPADPEEARERAEDFLTRLLESMGINAAISSSYDNGILNIDLQGDDMGVLIGKRGQTLDSIQYLTSLVVNKGKASYVRVKIDTENYRERRKATLENLAKNMAFKVKKTRRPAYLDPMNPYERRIIHSALQNDPYVTTHSEGEEPARKVVVTLRKREREEAAADRDFEE